MKKKIKRASPGFEPTKGRLEVHYADHYTTDTWLFKEQIFNKLKCTYATWIDRDHDFAYCLHKFLNFQAALTSEVYYTNF